MQSQNTVQGLTATSVVVMSENLSEPKKRILSIDIVRGIVMLIMALDHARDYFHIHAFDGDPTNMATTTPMLFFTRWITHFCAPIFVFLAGTSAFLTGVKKTKRQLSKFLLTRGIWLVFVELFIISLAWTFNPLYNVFILQVIWAIGLSMIILSLLVYLPFKIILAYGLIVVFGHNLLDYPEAARNGQVNLFWNITHHAFFYPVPLDKSHTAIIVYAFLPWSGVMALGYCFGSWFKNNVPSSLRVKRLMGLGASAIVLLVVLRLINAYGNPTQWQVQPRGAVYTFLSFLNTTKYPPSLMFLSMTLGPAFVSLALLEKAQGKLANIFITYGRVPFFYYVVHLFLIHFICVIFFFASGYGVKDIIDPNFFFLFRPIKFGFDLWVVYAVWLFAIVVLYFPCKWFNKYKSTHHQWWLSYV